MEKENLQIEFEAAAKPLMDFIKEHFHPNATAIVTMTTAELLEGSIGYSNEYNVNELKDGKR